MPGRLLRAAVVILLLGGCSLRTLAVNQVANTLAGGGGTFASDEDPELVGDALPFSLKLMESLLAESPEHRRLLLATARGFTQYTYGWVAQRADELEATDIEGAARDRARARALYLRARDYGLRAFRDPRVAAGLRTDARAAAGLAAKDDVPALYWTAAAWGLAISVSKNDPEVVADLPIVEALIRRAAQLDPSYDSGALDTFLISWEAAHPTGGPTARAKARMHFDRAVKLSHGRLASPFLAYAESVCVQHQQREEFDALLGRVLEIDVNAVPEWRLQNVIARRRAIWLLSRASDLFLEEDSSQEGGLP